MPTQLGTQLPSDPELMETTLAEAIKTTLLTAPAILSYSNVYAEERYPDSEEEDQQVATIPDPMIGNAKRRTSIIQIGVPTVEELPYAGGETCSQLNFNYPIMGEIEVVDLWADPSLQYSNSTKLVKAMYMQARYRFKRNADGSTNRNLGFVNCVHNFLQQNAAGTVEDEETGGRLHILDWSILVQCTGVVV